jgi:hypothetical protein
MIRMGVSLACSSRNARALKGISVLIVNGQNHLLRMLSCRRVLRQENDARSDRGAARKSKEIVAGCLIRGRRLYGGLPVSRFRNPPTSISASCEFRNRKDAGNSLNPSVVLVSKFAGW